MFLKHHDGSCDYPSTVSVYLCLAFSGSVLWAWVMLALEQKVSGRGVLALLTSAMKTAGGF